MSVITTNARYTMIDTSSIHIPSHYFVHILQYYAYNLHFKHKERLCTCFLSAKVTLSNSDRQKMLTNLLSCNYEENYLGTSRLPWAHIARNTQLKTYFFGK